VIIFTPSVNTPLYRISDSGGVATPITELDPKKNQTTHRWPYFLPDGHHFLFVSGTPFLPRENPSNAIEVGSLDSKERKSLMFTHAGAAYAAGHIFFLRQNTLMAQPFDPKHLVFTGDASPVADPVLEDTGTVRGVFSVSDSGTLAYVEGSSAAVRKLIWVDRGGKKVAEIEGAEAYLWPDISRDGKKIAYSLESPAYDIWSYDIGRGVKTRLTFGSAAAQANLFQVWSPDGRWIAYTSIRSGKFTICRKPSDGSGSEEVLLEGTDQLRYPTDWSSDGKFLTYREPQQGVWTVWMLPLTGERKPYAFLHSQFGQSYAIFSPNSKWVAYCSNESGEFKVYVVPFPGPGGKWQVSPGAGCTPRWRGDGKELFYLSMDNKVMSADVKASGSSFEVGAVHTLFETRPYSSFGSYDVTLDGQRFVVVQDTEQSSAAITLAVNWLAELKRK
jgi:Tol biopolymer transport system component